jgi:hypothetical protein
MRFGSCPNLYFLLKTVAVFVLMVAERSCEKQKRIIGRVLRISRNTSFLLAPVLPIGYFCAVILVLHY